VYVRLFLSSPFILFINLHLHIRAVAEKVLKAVTTPKTQKTKYVFVFRSRDRSYGPTWVCTCRPSSSSILQPSDFGHILSFGFALRWRTWPYRHGSHVVWDLQYDRSGCKVRVLVAWSDQVLKRRGMFQHPCLPWRGDASFPRIRVRQLSKHQRWYVDYSQFTPIGFLTLSCSGERALEQLNYSLIKNRAW